MGKEGKIKNKNEKQKKTTKANTCLRSFEANDNKNITDREDTI